MMVKMRLVRDFGSMDVPGNKYGMFFFLGYQLQPSHSPSSHHPDGDGLLQLPGRGVHDIAAHLDPLAAHPRLVKDVDLEKT